MRPRHRRHHLDSIPGDARNGRRSRCAPRDRRNGFDCHDRVGGHARTASRCGIAADATLRSPDDRCGGNFCGGDHVTLIDSQRKGGRKTRFDLISNHEKRGPGGAIATGCSKANFLLAKTKVHYYTRPKGGRNPGSRRQLTVVRHASGEHDCDARDLVIRHVRCVSRRWRVCLRCDCVWDLQDGGSGSRANDYACPGNELRCSLGP